MGRSGDIIHWSGRRDARRSDDALAGGQVPAEGPASLKVYESSGRLVRMPVQGRTRPGEYSTTWDATDGQGRRVGAGVYFYSLSTGSDLLRRKVVLTE